MITQAQHEKYLRLKRMTLNKPESALQKIRIDRGFTQQEMADQLHMKVRSYITLEKSKSIQRRSICTILKICDILQCSISDIVDDEAVKQDLKFLEYQRQQREGPNYIPETERDKQAIPNKKLTSSLKI